MNWRIIGKETGEGPLDKEEIEQVRHCCIKATVTVEFPEVMLEHFATTAGAAEHLSDIVNNKLRNIGTHQRLMHMLILQLWKSDNRQEMIEEFTHIFDEFTDDEHRVTTRVSGRNEQ